MSTIIERRELIAAFGGAALWPLAARAQQSPVVGFLSSVSASGAAAFVPAFQRGLNEGGFTEGKNVVVEYRFAEGQYDRLAELAADLVHRPVAVLVGAAPPAALAAKAATSTIPVVFVSGDDPIKSGLVERLNRPGGNVTGISVFSGSQLGAKQLNLLHDLIPAATEIGLLVNPTNSVQTEAQIKLIGAASDDLKLRLQIVKASTENEFDKAFATVVEQGCKALIVGADPLFVARREQLVALAERYSIPAIYEFRLYTAVGGLMSYGPSLQDGYRQAGVYVGRILKGEKPGDLPVVLPTRFELVINLKTAKKLGLKISDNVLSLADELIE
jgi:putative tryptophan/tyrosine transport system substrate-binding protein